MTLIELHTYLLVSSNTVFSNLELTGCFTSPAGYVTGFIRWLCMWLTKGIGLIVDAMETFVDYCYKFLSFGSNSNVKSLSNIMVNYSWIAILICLIIIGVKFASGISDKGDGKRFITNIAVLLVALVVLPNVFITIDKYVFGNNFLSSISDNSASTTVTNTIISAYTIDYYKLYEDVLENKIDETNGTTSFNSLSEVNKAIKEQVKKYKSSTNSTDFVNSNAFDINEEIKPDNLDGAEVPVFFKFKAISRNLIDDGSVDSSKPSYYPKYYLLGELHQTGFFGVDVGNQYYYRYNIDFLCVIISLFGTIIMYFCIGYSVLKLCTELIVHRIFMPLIAGTDLNGGDRIKKYLTSIIGCYVALFISALTVKLYALAVKYVASITADANLVGALINLCLAIIFMDIPNMIAKYFGINTGIRGAMAAAGLALRSAARAPGRIHQRHVSNSRYHKQQARYANQDSQRQTERAEQNRRYQESSQRQQRNEQRQSARDQQQANREQQQASNWEQQYGDHMDSNANEFDSINVDPNKSPEEQQNNVLGNAALMQAANESQYDIDNPINGDTQQVENALTTNYPNMSSEEKSEKAKAINNDSGMRNTSNQMYDNIGKNAESKIDSGGFSGKAAYDEAAKEYMDSKGKTFANDENRDRTASYMGAVAYTNSDQKAIRQQAKEYQVANKGISDKDAVIHTIRNSDKGYVKGLSDTQVNNVASRMLKNGSLSAGDYRDYKPQKNSFTSNLSGQIY